MSECDRCGKDVQEGYPLETPSWMDSWVCGDCLKDSDAVLQL